MAAPKEAGRSVTALFRTAADSNQPATRTDATRPCIGWLDSLVVISPTLRRNSEHLKRVVLRKSDCVLQVIVCAAVSVTNVEVEANTLTSVLDAKPFPAVGRPQPPGVSALSFCASWSRLTTPINGPRPTGSPSRMTMIASPLHRVVPNKRLIGP